MAGFPLPFVEIRVRAGDEDVPWDGETMGELEVRGPWVAAATTTRPRPADRCTEDGWFQTGDIVTIDPRGYIQIKDRSKDVIKSGGEWITSVELENALMAHPAVAEAAVIAIPDEKWGERPLAAVVLKEGATATRRRAARVPRAAVREVVAARAIEFVAEIPKTSVGKFRKTALREQFAREPAGELRRPSSRRSTGRSSCARSPTRSRDGEALVRVRAAGINFIDVLIRRGRYPQMPEFPRCWASSSPASSRTGRA